MNNLNDIRKEIKNWQNCKGDLPTLLAIFQSGNRFSLSISKDVLKDSAFIHAYAVVDSNNENFGFILVPSDVDTVECFEHLSSNIGNYTYQPVRKYFLVEQLSTNNSISIEETLKRVLRWNTPEVLERWVTDTIKENRVLQAFVIPSSDIEYGTDHTCLLALEENDETKELTADLIIHNTYTNKIVLSSSINTTGELEDMVRPVPQFDPDPKNKTAYSEEAFGIIEAIK